MTVKEQEIHVDDFFNKMKSILISKAQDYSKSEIDVLSNFKMVAQIIGVKPEQVVLNLIATKVVRLGNLIGNGKIPNNESIQDNLLDLANYTVLLNMVRSEPQIEVY
jgi:hypothetical protein